jgi:hypothetical protein
LFIYGMRLDVTSSETFSFENRNENLRRRFIVDLKT